MGERKPLEDLTLMDDYMFYAVMNNNKNLLIKLLQCILDITIIDLDYSKGQETVKDGYDSRGVRLDVFARDENDRWYNIEVQTTDKKDIPERSRYNQAVLDVDRLKPGDRFNELKECFVIFITKFDTHGRDKKLYWFESRDRYEEDLLFGNGVNNVIVNVTGKNGKVSKDLAEVIEYLRTGETSDDYTQELDKEVKTVKRSDERKAEYMRYIRYEDELRLDERLRTRAEAVMNLMDTMHLDVDTILENMKVKESDRPRIKELIAEMMNEVPA